MNAKIRTLSAILLTACMLVSGMLFGAFAENEPATPTDLAPIGEETPAEPGTGENNEITDKDTPADEVPADEVPAGEQTNPAEKDGEDSTAADENGEGTEEKTEVRIPELPFGTAGYRGTLKAGEAFEIALRPEYSRNILVTLTLVPKTGSIPDAASVRMTLNGEKKNPVRIENEEPESKGITLQFGTYAAKDNEYILSITSPADADFILTAVKRPEAAPEETDNEDGEEETDGKEEKDGEEKTEAEGDGESTGTPADKAEDEVTAEPETAAEPETNTEETEGPAATPETGSAEETEEPAENGEQPADGAESEAGTEPETAVEPEEPQAEPVKNEPATPTDLAPIGENTQEKPADNPVKTDSGKENGKKEKKEKEEEKATLPTAEELLALGYYGSQVAMTTGADIFESMEEGAEPAAHLEPGEELWLRPTGNEAWAEIYRADEKDPVRYIRWDDVIITLKPEPEGEEEEEEPLPARCVEVTSTLWDMLSIPFGTEITMTGELVNFREDDICTFQWQYRTEDSDTFTDIEGANELTYTYQINRQNYYYIWRLTVLVEREE